MQRRDESRPTRVDGSIRDRGSLRWRGGRGSRDSTRLAEVLETVQAALAGADEVDVAVAVEVDGGHLQAGAGGAGGEVLLGIATGGLRGGVLGGLSGEEGMLVPGLLRLVEGEIANLGGLDVA